MKATLLVPLSSYMHEDGPKEKASEYDTFTHTVHEEVYNFVVEEHLWGEMPEMVCCDVTNSPFETQAIIDHLRANTVS